MIRLTGYKRGNAATSKLRISVRELKKSESHLGRAAEITSNALADEAPIETGLVVQRTSLIDNIGASGYDAEFGVGPFSETGSPYWHGRGLGTIAAFLRAFPRYKTAPPPEPRLAWWYLPEEGKAMLDVQRQAGLYGGSRGGKIMPMYWGAIVGGKVPGVAANDFTGRALTEARIQYRLEMRLRVLGR